MKKKLPLLSLWILAAATWTLFLSTHLRASDTIRLSIAPSTASDPAAPAEATDTDTLSEPSKETPDEPSCISLSTASREELISLPRIGPVLADRIIAYRKEKGAFSEVKELDNVKGIGPATLRKLERLVCR